MTDTEQLAELSTLRTATPVDDPAYADIERRYRELSDKVEQEAME